MPPGTTHAWYEFGPFRLEIATRSLYRAGEFVPLAPKAAETLLLLVEEAGRVVTKDQLLERVWPGVVVEEGGIANNISALRKVLDADFPPDGPIGTVARRGYRFAADVRKVDGPTTASTPAATNGMATPERNTILVADIENKTGNPIFDGTIRQALVLNLAQSPFLEVVSDRKAHALLGFMGKQGAPLLGEVALEICQRTGSRAAITGSIFGLGDDYVIGLQAVDGQSGDVLVTEQARAHGKGEVLKAIDQAAVGLRTKLGESLASVRRFSLPFDEVATASLEALKAYTLARHEWLEHGEAAGKPHYLRAIELDPHFASAYSALGHSCTNMGQTQDALLYMTKAYELRDRVTERERVRIMAAYYDSVLGDTLKSLDAHRVWESAYPRDASAATNTGNLFAIVGRWEEALAAARRGYDLEPLNIASSNLAIAQLALGKHEDARATLQDAFARGFTAFFLHLDAYQEAFLRGDTEAMQRYVAAVAGRDGEEDFLIAAQADTEAYHGRFVRARELSRRAVGSARRGGSPEMAGTWAAQAALREAEVGALELAREGAAEALGISNGRNVRCVAALALARAGDADGARAIADALDRECPQHTIVQRYWLASIRAAIAIGASDWKAALDALEPATSVELAITLPFEGGFMIPVYLRAVALQGAGRHEEAAREFMKIVERPGLIKNFVLHPLALHGAAKALSAAGHAAEAKVLRGKFDGLWKSADVSPATH